MGHLHATNEDLINDTRVIFEDDQIIIGGHDLWTKGYMKGTFPLLTKFITNICKQGGKRSYLPISDDVDDDDDNVYLALAGGHQKKKKQIQRTNLCWTDSNKTWYVGIATYISWFCARFCLDSAHYVDYIIIFMFCLLPKVQTVVIYICAGLPRSTDIAVEKHNFITIFNK